MPPNTQAVQIGVCGIGQMGASAAVCFSRAGFPVLLWARCMEKLSATPAALSRMSQFLDEHIGPATCIPGPIELTGDLERLNINVSVILECIAEDLGQKVDLLRRLAPATERGAVLASCTSGLSISTMGRQSGSGRRLVGAHFWNPPHLMPVVEVIRGAETDEGLIEFMSDLVQQAGKVPVVCKDVPGFIGNRLLHALWREAIHLVQEGICTAEDVDRVARLTFALRMPAVGPCENIDLVGLELLAQIQSYLLRDLASDQSPQPIIVRMLRENHLGMKSGQGFHDWTQRAADELLDQRDRQIVHQLRFLKDLGRLA
jgi:3-hydroxybutyryl-CoA dehydrogenase